MYLLRLPNAGASTACLSWGLRREPTPGASSLRPSLWSAGTDDGRTSAADGGLCVSYESLTRYQSVKDTFACTFTSNKLYLCTKYDLMCLLCGSVRRSNRSMGNS